MQYQKKTAPQDSILDGTSPAKIKRQLNTNQYLIETQNNSIFSNRPLTPTRKHGLASPNKIRTEKSLKGSSFLKHNSQEISCTNHTNKAAQFLIQTEDQQLPYCQKCSILLASQGFKLIKLPNSQEQSNILDAITDDKRRNQISGFLSELQTLQQNMNSSRSKILSKINKSSQNFQVNIQQINHYYQYILDSISNHKNETIQLLRQHMEQGKRSVKAGLQLINKCTKESDRMRDDIIESIQLIKDAEEEVFRPILDSYYEQIQSFQECLQEVKNYNVMPVSLVFNNVEDVVKNSTDLIQIAFDQRTNYGTGRSSNLQFSFEQNVPEEINQKSSKIFQIQKPQTSGYRSSSPLKNNGLNKPRIGDSIAQHI